MLERAMWRRAKNLHTVREDDTQKVTAELAKADDGDGLLTVPEFRAAWARLGLPLTAEEAALLIARGPRDPDGRCRYEAYVRGLLKGQSRSLSNALVCKGYPVNDGDYLRKIIYPRCRTSVFAPQPWQPELADASLFPPDAELELRHVYSGPRGQALAVGDGSEFVFFSAAAGALVNRETTRQRFFLGHTNDIASVAVCPCPIVAPDGTVFPPKTLVATGQHRPVEDALTREKECPYVSIWDSRSLEEIVRIPHDSESRAVVAMAFSPDGAALVTVTADNAHTVTVWDWRAYFSVRKDPKKGQLKPRGWLGEGNGYADAPIAVYGVIWDSYPRGLARHKVAPEGTEAARNVAAAQAAPGGGCVFATFGAKHLKLWDTGRDGRWASVTWSFGKCKQDDVLCATFLPPPADGAVTLATGMPGGDVCLWRSGAALMRVSCHKTKPRAGSGVRCIGVVARGRGIVTGGGDGAIRVWEFDKEGPCLKGDMGALGLPTVAGAPPLQLTTMDILDGGTGLLVATDAGNLWEVALEPLTGSPSAAPAPKKLLDGLAAGTIAYASAWHPAKPDVFASVSDNGEVVIWDAAKRQRLRGAFAAAALRSVAISPTALGELFFADPSVKSHHVAVGGSAGQLTVADECTLEAVFSAQVGVLAIGDIKYSPDGTMMAVASHDTHITIFLARSKSERGYAALRRCSGHCAAVRHLDWSADSTSVASTSADSEVLFWSAGTGKQTARDMRNTDWATWTSVLGFPCMGIWPEDGARPLCADRSSRGDLLVVGDDRNVVRLYRFPSVVEAAPFKKRMAHGSFVVSVRMSADDRRIISAGSKDGTLMQWAVVPLEPPPPPPPEPQPQWLPLDDTGVYWGMRLPRPGEKLPEQAPDVPPLQPQQPAGWRGEASLAGGRLEEEDEKGGDWGGEAAMHAGVSGRAQAAHTGQGAGSSRGATFGEEEGRVASGARPPPPPPRELGPTAEDRASAAGAVRPPVPPGDPPPRRRQHLAPPLPSAPPPPGAAYAQQRPPAPPEGDPAPSTETGEQFVFVEAQQPPPPVGPPMPQQPPQPPPAPRMAQPAPSRADATPAPSDPPPPAHPHIAVPPAQPAAAVEQPRPAAPPRAAAAVAPPKAPSAPPNWLESPPPSEIDDNEEEEELPSTMQTRGRPATAGPRVLQPAVRPQPLMQAPPGPGATAVRPSSARVSAAPVPSPPPVRSVANAAGAQQGSAPSVGVTAAGAVHNILMGGAGATAPSPGPGRPAAVIPPPAATGAGARAPAVAAAAPTSAAYKKPSLPPASVKSDSPPPSEIAWSPPASEIISDDDA